MTDREKLVDALQEDAARLTGYMNAEPSGAHTVRLGMMTVGAILERILAAVDLLSQEDTHLRARLSSERKPDGWITESDAKRIRDRSRPYAPAVNVWASRDDGDLPVYIGHPPEEP